MRQLAASPHVLRPTHKSNRRPASQRCVSPAIPIQSAVAAIRAPCPRVTAPTSETFSYLLLAARPVTSCGRAIDLKSSPIPSGDLQNPLSSDCDPVNPRGDDAGAGAVAAHLCSVASTPAGTYSRRKHPQTSMEIPCRINAGLDAISRSTVINRHDRERHGFREFRSNTVRIAGRCSSNSEDGSRFSGRGDS